MKARPEHQWRSFFKKSTFYFFSPHTFLKLQTSLKKKKCLLSSVGFPAPPRLLKDPASVRAGTATTPIPKFCDLIRFRIFHFVSPHPTYRWGVELGMGNRTKKPSSPSPGPGALSAVFDQLGNKKGSATHEPPALVSSYLPKARSLKTRGRWELPPRSQQTSTQQA